MTQEQPRHPERGANSFSDYEAPKTHEQFPQSEDSASPRHKLAGKFWDGRAITALPPAAQQQAIKNVTLGLLF
jgi:hypothetical protein